jgi:hypothetical protein
MRPIRFVMLCCLLASAAAFAQHLPPLSNGQTLYLPVYSHVLHGDIDSKGRPRETLVSALVSVRNTDRSQSIRLVSAQYYDTDGRKIREYVGSPTTIKPMGTFEIYVPRSDSAGGSGANFVIAWQSDKPANPPVVEALHLNLPAGRSISFITSARPILSE